MKTLPQLRIEMYTAGIEFHRAVLACYDATRIPEQPVMHNAAEQLITVANEYKKTMSNVLNFTASPPPRELRAEERESIIRHLELVSVEVRLALEQLRDYGYVRPWVS